MSPRLAIVIPCFNHGSFLDEALDSALGQTEPVEIVVVDDASTDRATRAKFDAWNRPDIPLIRQETNRGKPAAVNRGIAATAAPFVLVLDADDVLAPTFAERLIPVLESRPEVGIVYPAIEKTGKHSGPITSPEFSLERMLRNNVIHNGGVFRRADWVTLGGFDEELVEEEDWERWLSILELGREVVFVPEPLYGYRRHWIRWHHKSRRVRWEKRTRERDRIYRKHQALFARHPEILFDRIRDLDLEVGRHREARFPSRFARFVQRLLGF